MEEKPEKVKGQIHDHITIQSQSSRYPAGCATILRRAEPAYRWPAIATPVGETLSITRRQRMDHHGEPRPHRRIHALLGRSDRQTCSPTRPELWPRAAGRTPP